MKKIGGIWIIRTLYDRRYVPRPQSEFSKCEDGVDEGSHHSRWYNYDNQDRDDDDISRPLMAAAETTPSGDITTHILRVSAIRHLTEFNG